MHRLSLACLWFVLSDLQSCTSLFPGGTFVFFPLGHTHAVFYPATQPGHPVNSKTLATSEAGQVGSYLKVQIRRDSPEQCGGKLHEGTPQAAQSCLSGEVHCGMWHGQKWEKSKEKTGQRSKETWILHCFMGYKAFPQLSPPPPPPLLFLLLLLLLL